jgi:hypothetical protein
MCKLFDYILCDGRRWRQHFGTDGAKVILTDDMAGVVQSTDITRHRKFLTDLYQFLRLPLLSESITVSSKESFDAVSDCRLSLSCSCDVPAFRLIVFSAHYNCEGECRIIGYCRILTEQSNAKEGL